MQDYTMIKAQDLKQIDQTNSLLLDVRTRMEHAQKHLDAEHVLVPLDELKPRELMKQLGLNLETEVFLLCRSGKRAVQAAEKFASDGYQNIKVIEGGIVACEESGHKILGFEAEPAGCPAKKKAPISLERQVRITAGLLVTLGSVLGLAINPLFILLPLFMGLGLIFAGVTDNCGMALLLAKAPWNNAKRGSCEASSKCSKFKS